MTTHANWSALGAGGLYGGNTMGSGSAMPVARSELEASRMGTGRVPQAEYPDGYLGSIRSRRDDRLLDSTKNRVNQRSYQRGVHKGERIDMGDYAWPDEFNPQTGLVTQAAGMRQAPIFELALPPHLVNDGKSDMRAPGPAEIDQRRVAQLSRMRPAWR